MTPVFALIIITVVAVGVALYRKPRRKIQLSDGYQRLLVDHVAFYRGLDEASRHRFEEKIKELLGYIRITGINTTVDDIDRLLIASSGVIPIFGFPEWKYYNLSEVL